MQHWLSTACAVVLLSVLLSACFNPAIPASGVLCSTSQGCPDAQRCEVVIGACVDTELPAVAALRFKPLEGPFEATVALPGVEVELLDAAGQVTPVSGGHLAISVAEAPVDVALTGTTEARPAFGVVSFPGIATTRPVRRMKLGVVGGALTATSAYFDIQPTRPVVTKLPAPGAVSGCGLISYTVAQAQDLPVDLLVEIDPDGPAGPSPFRPATPAESESGQPGIVSVPALRGGAAHLFSWNTSVDLAGMDASALLRVTPSIQGLAGEAMSTPVEVRNGMHFTLRSQPSQVLLVADVDRDGWPDEVDTDGFALYVEYGPFSDEPNGGALRGAAVVDVGAGLDAKAVTVADLDHHGRLDLAIIEGSGDLSIARAAAPARSFTLTRSVLASGARQLAAADVDGDGHDDLVVLSGSTVASSIALLRPRASAPPFTFDSRLVWSGDAGATNLIIADVNHDGAPDVVVGRNGAPVLVFAQGPLRGEFAAPFSDPAVAGSTVRVTDLDHDGHLEIAALGTSGLTVLELAPHPGIEPEGAPRAFGDITGTHFTVGDLDGDGRTDIVSADASGSKVHLHVADRTAMTFQPTQQLSSRAATGVWLSDLDRDGRMDFISTAGSTAAVSFGATARTCGAGIGSPRGSMASSDGSPADINGDGKLDLFAITTFTRHVLVSYGLGDGRFTPSVALDDGAGNTLVVDHVAFADLDGDGFMDRIEVESGAAQVVTRLQDHSHPGSYLKGSTVDLGIGLVAIGAADVDLDGAVDLLGMGDGQVVWRPGNPRVPGTFLERRTLPASVEASETTCTALIHCGFTVTDLDNDGWPEIVVQTHARLQILRGTLGEPGAFAAATATDFFDNVDVVGSGDLVGDRGTELVVRDTDVDFQLDVLAMASDGSLHSKWVTALPSGFTRAAVGDFDGDGRDDLAVGDRHRNVRIVTPRDIASGGVLPSTFQIFASGDLTLGDFDQDGRPDLVVCGRSCLHFSASDLRAALTSLDPWSTVGYTDLPVTGDLNDDGLPDLSAGGRLQIQRADGSSRFDSVGEPVNGVMLLADLNGDGFDDWIDGAAPMTIGLTDGTGASHTVTCATSMEASVEQAADVDRDGRSDVVRAGAGEVRVIRDVLGACTTSDPIITYADFLEGSRIELRDMNGDGWLDVVVQAAGLYIALQRPEAPGSFSEATFYDVLGERFEIVDLDRDGVLDVVAAGQGADWWRGDPSARGTLSPPTTLASVDSVTGVLVADVDRDGLPDLVVEDNGGEMQIFLRDAAPGPQFTYAYDTVGRDATDHQGLGEFLDLDADGRLDFLYTDRQRGTTLVRGR